MNSGVKKVALYTTIYPGVKAYLPDWYRSLGAQTDKDYHLWVGLDGIEPEVVERMIGAQLDATWILSEPGDTPAQIRQRAMARIVEACDAVILVDSDDILQESRLAAARAFLETSELTGCALRLVDEEGRELGSTFGLPPGTRVEDVLPQHNVFGLSNSAYRSDLLRRCLPVPAGVVLVDWFLATQAWLMGARLAFDPVARMDYRQHGANMARVRFPVGQEQVVRDTELVRQHFHHVLAVKSADFLPHRLAQVEQVASNVESFKECIVRDPYQLRRYVEALNLLKPAPIWWSSVAHPGLESMWQASTTCQS
jgi:hypothetical protein